MNGKGNGEMGDGRWEGTLIFPFPCPRPALASREAKAIWGNVETRVKQSITRSGRWGESLQGVHDSPDSYWRCKRLESNPKQRSYS